jgi:hypothetical protein
MRSTNPTDAQEQHRREPQIAADDRIVHPLERHAPSLVGLRKLAREAVGDGSEVGVGSLDRHAWLQASDHVEHVGGAGAWRKVDERSHRPDAALPHQLEVFRHDANHGPERPVEADLATNYVWIGVESGAPERLAHHDHVCAPGLVFSGKRPAGYGSDAQHVEYPGRDPLP